MQIVAERSQDYTRVERAIRYIDANRLDQPTLEDVADAMGLSPAHAQRVFQRWAGLSPKRFLGLLTVEHAKTLLRGSESVLGSAYEVGLSGGSRLHDLFLNFEAMTPGEYKAKGADLELRWGVHPTPFGNALFVTSPRGLARLVFLGTQSLDAAVAEAQADWPLSRLVHDQDGTAATAQRAFAADSTDEPLSVLVKGTPFQVQVWRALMRIPEGQTASYAAIARDIGHPAAVRAVGTACGRNRLGVLIPCHRVIRETGGLGGYQWGVERKRAILAWESAHRMRGLLSSVGG